MKTTILTITALALAAYTPACGDEAATSGTPTGPGATGLGQAGAQDFGLFRQILEDGEIPSPDTIDAIGFFAEHKLDYPPATCGEEVCLHALLGAMGNMLTGADCVVVQLGLNTPIDPETLERPPLDLVLALDTSGSMTGTPIESMKAGLVRMLDHLENGDTVTLVTYSDSAVIVAAQVVVDATGKTTLEGAIRSVAAAGRTNIYDGLFVAYEAAAGLVAPGREARVVLLSDGEATAGMTTPERMTDLAAAYAREGIGLTTIGVGKDFDVEVMRGLAEVGAGNFYFLEDPTAVREVFTEEVDTFLHPIALDVVITFSTGPGYAARRAYGVRDVTGGAAGGIIRMPALYLAGRRTAAEPITGGRRGGGGAIIIELVPWSAPHLTALGLSPEELSEVGTVNITWTDPDDGQRKQVTTDITSPFAALELPSSGYFSTFTVEKGFVMLNIYTAFALAADLALNSDPGAARGVLEALRPAVTNWLSRHPDTDIEDDLRYVDLFIDNLATVEAQTPISRPPEPWPVD